MIVPTWLRAPGQEIDGNFTYGGKHFLVEVRWRQNKADFNALSHFHSKVKTRLVSTVGLFVSIEGFAPNAISSLIGLGDRCVLMLDGAQFVKIINGYLSLPDALDQIIHEAHKRGTVVVDLKV